MVGYGHDSHNLVKPGATSSHRINSWPAGGTDNGLTPERPQGGVRGSSPKDGQYHGRVGCPGSPNSLAVVLKAHYANTAYRSLKSALLIPLLSACAEAPGDTSVTHTTGATPCCANRGFRTALNARLGGKVPFCLLNTTSGTHRDTTYTDTHTHCGQTHSSQPGIFFSFFSYRSSETT